MSTLNLQSRTCFHTPNSVIGQKYIVKQLTDPPRDCEYLTSVTGGIGCCKSGALLALESGLSASQHRVSNHSVRVQMCQKVKYQGYLAMKFTSKHAPI